MMTTIVVGLVLIWILLSTLIIIGVAMATSQGSRREQTTKRSLDTSKQTAEPQIQIGQKRGRLTRPRPQWAEGPPRSMRPYQN